MADDKLGREVVAVRGGGLGTIKNAIEQDASSLTTHLVRVLADPMFFTHPRVGHYLLSIGGLPTTYPHKYEAIARDILHGGWWLIFPEGSMMKDRKVIDRGRLQVSDATGSGRRPPHSGAARIMLTVQRYQAALRHAVRTGENLEDLCTTLGLHHLSPTHLQALAQRPAALVPLNVTYYPLNPQATLLTSWLTRLVSALLHADLRARLVEELTVEVMAEAIRRAVRAARSVPGAPAIGDAS